VEWCTEGGLKAGWEWLLYGCLGSEVQRRLPAGRRKHDVVACRMFLQCGVSHSGHSVCKAAIQFLSQSADPQGLVTDYTNLNVAVQISSSYLCPMYSI